MHQNSKEFVMSRRTDALFVILQEACKAQFGFAPERISDNLQYMGPLTGVSHRFRDHMSHSEIHLSLNPPTATLFQREGEDEPDWPESLLQAYCKSDEQLQAEQEAWDEKLRFALASPLWASYSADIHAMFRDHPTYNGSAPVPRVGAYDLVVELSAKGDLELAAFAEKMGTQDLHELSSYLLKTHHREAELEVWDLVKDHPNIQAIENLIDQVLAGDKAADKEAGRLSTEMFPLLPQHHLSPTTESLLIVLVMRDRSARKAESARASAPSQKADEPSMEP
jgi:hypothetical protein